MLRNLLTRCFDNTPRSRPARRPQPSVQLKLECLEGRLVPTAVVRPYMFPATVRAATLLAPQAVDLSQLVINFCKTHLGQKVGGGECAHLANEALRVAGADFASHDPNHNGDYTWGTLLTTLTPGHDSNPLVACKPGDIIQFQAVTLAGGWTAFQHTAIVAAVDSLGRPTQVYEQNVGVNGKGPGFHDRHDRLDMLTVNAKTLTAGTIHIYRPSARQDVAGTFQYSVVNNTAAPVTVTLYINNQSIGSMSLTAFNTAGSYSIGKVFGSGGTFSIGINGHKVALTNAGGYEVFTDSLGQLSIRAI